MHSQHEIEESLAPPRRCGRSSGSQAFGLLTPALTAAHMVHLERRGPRARAACAASASRSCLASDLLRGAPELRGGRGLGGGGLALEPRQRRRALQERVRTSGRRSKLMALRADPAPYAVATRSPPPPAAGAAALGPRGRRSAPWRAGKWADVCCIDLERAGDAAAGRSAAAIGILGRP